MKTDISLRCREDDRTMLVIGKATLIKLTGTVTVFQCPSCGKTIEVTEEIEV